jgi:hypothetical protein
MHMFENGKKWGLVVLVEFLGGGVVLRRGMVGVIF